MHIFSSRRVSRHSAVGGVDTGFRASRVSVVRRQHPSDEGLSEDASPGLPSPGASIFRTSEKSNGSKRSASKQSSHSASAPYRGGNASFERLLTTLAVEISNLEARCAAHRAQAEILRSELLELRSSHTSRDEFSPRTPPRPRAGGLFSKSSKAHNHSRLAGGPALLPCPLKEESEEQELATRHVAELGGGVAQSCRIILDDLGPKETTPWRGIAGNPSKLEAADNVERDVDMLGCEKSFESISKPSKDARTVDHTVDKEGSEMNSDSSFSPRLSPRLDGKFPSHSSTASPTSTWRADLKARDSNGTAGTAGLNRMSWLSARQSAAHSVRDTLRSAQALDLEPFYTSVRSVSNVRLTLWRFINDPDSSCAAKLYSRIMNPFFLTTMLFAMAQHTEPPLVESWKAEITERVFEIVFATEIIIRLCVCPSKSAFFQSLFNWIDICSAVPLALRMAAGGFDGMQNTLLCIVPILRFMKLQRRFEKFHLVYTAFVVSLEAMPVLLYTIWVVILTFSTVIYVAEPRENVSSLPQALWLVVVTVATVGYGDLYPVSTVGKLITSVLIFLSMLLLAIPVGIVGNAFNRVWEDRRRLLLLKRTRVRLTQWGYSSHDIPKLFSVFGKEEALDFNAFLTMMTEMKIGMDESDIWELFKSFDEDGGGSVEPDEFISQIFPEDYVSLQFQGGLYAEIKGAAARATSAIGRGSIEHMMSDGSGKAKSSMSSQPSREEAQERSSKAERNSIERSL